MVKKVSKKRGENSYNRREEYEEERGEKPEERYERNARISEGDARDLENKYGENMPRHIRDELIRLYERAGDQRYKAGQFARAKRDYEEAKEDYEKSPVLADDETEKRVQKKIDSAQKRIYSRGQTKKKEGMLERLSKRKQNIFVVGAILSLTLALMFISFNLTGAFIGNLNYEMSNFVSIALFIVGLMLSYFYLKNNKKK